MELAAIHNFREKVMATSKSKGGAGSRGEANAIAMLTADHKKVKGLFNEFKKLKEDGGNEREKVKLVQKICEELKVHAELEEEIFYPAVREAIDDSDIMDEALVEHAGAKDLIAQLEIAQPGDELYDAKVTVLGEQINHHVKEEEGEMFPKAKKAKLDQEALASEMTARKQELLRQMGSTPSDQERPETKKRANR
jgi:hemerythrin superfamily protein